MANDESELKCIYVYYEGNIKCMRSLTIHILLFNYFNTVNEVRVITHLKYISDYFFLIMKYFLKSTKDTMKKDSIHKMF